MMNVPPSIRRQVVQRAGDCCEYCGISQALQEATFHVDHVKPRRMSGNSTLENLALACVSCFLRKGARS
jgi:5-methylcytosine-specific restriction endonuclease McrA